MVTAAQDVLGPGRVAVVTGAASGIGRALSLELAAAGSALVLADVDVAGLDESVEAVRATGVDAERVMVDVSDARAVDGLAAAALERFGRVDVLCNNAGVSTFNLMADQTLDDWRWVFDVNVWGVVHGLQSFMPIFRQQGTPAHIVNTASIAGLLSGIAFLGPYAATKVAVVSISETLRAEIALADLPIGVSVLCPSSVDTRVLDTERVRPAMRGNETRTEMADSVRQMIRDSFTGPTGLAPEAVARLTVDAIRAKRFWIVTHPGERPAVEARLADIVASMPVL